jgi:hypothetical protein
MQADTVSEVWDVLRHHIDLSSRKEAAEELVAFMIENNLDAGEIKTAFRGDKDIIKATAIYNDQDAHEDEEDDYENFDDEDY